MAGQGPAPKDNRVRRNADSVDTITLAESPTDVPRLRGYARYSAATRAWWDTWANSPQAAVFAPTDWMRLSMLAPLVEQYHEEPKTALLAEIRLNEERLGATVADRQRLRMKIEGPKENKPKLAPVRDIADRRKSLED
ncbi:phage terminase small subunit [Nonomuraea roseola]|uniref:Terminase small subunit n=1 Tax=Nonomuraea roseola TaxID=46179 RepID=A0ABV5Q227_9ACTN